MARDQVDLTPIETRDELVAWFAEGAKPPSQFRIGTEHEKFAFSVEGHQPVPYEGRRSIRGLLEGMQMLLGWDPIMEGPNIIGLSDVTGGGAISLEPGGQFELSGAPVATIHRTCSELMAHLAQLRQVAEPLGIGFLGLGMTPNWSRAEIPMMPKGRYRIMTARSASGHVATPPALTTGPPLAAPSCSRRPCSAPAPAGGRPRRPVPPAARRSDRNCASSTAGARLR